MLTSDLYITIDAEMIWYNKRQFRQIDRELIDDIRSLKLPVTLMNYGQELRMSFNTTDDWDSYVDLKYGLLIRFGLQEVSLLASRMVSSLRLVRFIEFHECVIRYTYAASDWGKLQELQYNE